MFLFVIFFSVRATTFFFLLILVLCFETFFGQFSGLYSVFRSIVIPNRMKTSAKKGRKANICQKVSQTKKSILNCQFFFFHTILVQKPEKFQANSFYGS